MASPQNTPNIPSAKRRRVDTANATLKKPFRSPMINRQAQQSPATSSVNATPTQASPSLSRSINTLSRPSASSSSSIPVTPSRPGNPSPLRPGTSSTARRPLLLQRSFKPVSTPSPLKQRQQGTTGLNNEGDGLLQRIQRSHGELDQQMKKLEKELELVRQAKRIEEASRRKRPGEEVDAELRELVGRWKGASRLAAEELFEVVKGRVDGMGGGGAWRESRKRRFGDWDDDGRGKKVEGGEEREGYRSELEGEDRGEEDQKEEEGDDTEGFTMLMMLKSLNIEPEVLGWDPGEEKWMD
ncbi:hypothetical protein QBC41DRAFT_396081 [Cercophora samala]|uniref:Swi5-dependent recombination DNA repair protein 1 n=1 Tax=Cercophora samala TaxID=330535 RepID=A0AA39ZAH4_9PEZI|nr:hypothetical protein QBC41DRAFT_396081 [Cercophora samala]